MATIYTHIASNKRKSVLLLAFFIVFILLIGWILNRTTEGGAAFIVLAAIVAVIMSLVGYYQGDKIALWTTGARPVTKEQAPYLYRIIENLAITAGLPMPAVYLIEDDAPNAFATGRDPRHASIAVTTGIIQLLENEELEGVIAHELSHIGNYDVRFLTLVVVLVGIVSIVSDMFVRSTFLGRRRDNRSGGGALALIGLLLIILSPIIAQLIKLAVSRKREYLADASGALLTRYPDGLASALEKIGSANRPMARASNATAHLFIANPFAGKSLSGLFATHPPIEDRVQVLRQMAGNRT
ncbi:MAG: M48 family metalloprotease [Candidatus Kerfeldbacteria bacterium]|nr:M48 family metalloprotease [Candidatus Kerfeldbacteria bacterium]